MRLRLSDFMFQEKNADIGGEALRAAFFDESKGMGCYQSFDVNPWVERVKILTVYYENKPDPHERPDEEWQVYRADIDGEVYHMAWFWDGDGTLLFFLPDGRYLINEDCQKDHRWEFVDSSELSKPVAEFFDSYWASLPRA